MSDDFSARMQGIIERVEEAIPAAVFKGAEHVRAVAVSRAPLEKGKLRAESHTDMSGPETATVTFDGPYARYQEFGISHSGKPLNHEVGQSLYLTSSILGEEPAVMQILTQEINNAIDE